MRVCVCVCVCVKCPVIWKTAPVFGFSSARSLLTPGLLRQGCGGQGEAATTSWGCFCSSCCSLHPWQCCEATGWGGTVEGDPAREVGVRERKGERGLPHPLAARPAVLQPPLRAKTQCHLCWTDGEQNPPSRVGPYQSYPWSEAATGLGNTVLSSHVTEEKTEAHAGEMQGWE